jgi:protein involved in polysaccharide export with SLBB domain
MNKLVLSIAISTLSLVSVSAQVKTSATTGQPRELAGTSTMGNSSRPRVIGSNGRVENKNEASAVKTLAIAYTDNKGNLSKASLKTATAELRDTSLNSSTDASATKTRPRIKDDPATPPAVAGSSTVLSQVYRVGVGDVLDVQLVDSLTTKSTLFTVLDGGVLEYPLAGDPFPVAGLTADEVATRLCARIKVFENPKVVVKVRDYASHSVVITGLVSAPGAKFLRREAIPFYVALAEAEPRPEAARATLTRSGQPAINIDLNDQGSTAVFVLPGDVIKVFGAPPQPAEYFYVGGAINSPGQKSFHSGLTLTQAILASGGVSASAGTKAKVSRQGSDGRLTTTEYNLRQIEDGKTPDPVLQRGDRIAIP